MESEVCYWVSVLGTQYAGSEGRQKWQSIKLRDAWLTYAQEGVGLDPVDNGAAAERRISLKSGMDVISLYLYFDIYLRDLPTLTFRKIISIVYILQLW